MPKEITFEELDHLIDSQEDKGIKKGLLIVKSSLRPLKGNRASISKPIMLKVVNARITAEELVADELEGIELDEIHDDIAQTAVNLGKVIHICYPEEDSEE